jgi:hypothetical protein
MKKAVPNTIIIDGMFTNPAPPPIIIASTNSIAAPVVPHVCSIDNCHRRSLIPSSRPLFVIGYKTRPTSRTTFDPLTRNKIKTDLPR